MIIYAYKAASYLKRYIVDELSEFWDVLEGMRSATTRPDIIIYEADEVSPSDIDVILWAVKIMRIVDNSIEGPDRYSRRYMTRIINHDFNDTPLNL